MLHVAPLVPEQLAIPLAAIPLTLALPNVAVVPDPDPPPPEPPPPEPPPPEPPPPDALNVAVTCSSEFIVTWQLPVPEQPPPDQPAKLEPFIAPQLSVTVDPPTKLAEQALPTAALVAQLIPDGLLLTMPEPLPATETVRVWPREKVAVTACAALTVTTHVPVPLQPPPDQPANPDPIAGIAVSVTCVPPG